MEIEAAHFVPLLIHFSLFCFGQAVISIKLLQEFFADNIFKIIAKDQLFLLVGKIAEQNLTYHKMVIVFPPPSAQSYRGHPTA